MLLPLQIYCGFTKHSDASTNGGIDLFKNKRNSVSVGMESSLDLFFLLLIMVLVELISTGFALLGKLSDLYSW